MYTPAHFLIRCPLPGSLHVEEGDLAIAQAVAVDRLLLAGQLLQYAVSEDDEQWWAIIPAQTEWHARELASSLPWCDAEQIQISELSYFACNETQGFSLN